MDFRFNEVDASLNLKEFLFLLVFCLLLSTFIIFAGGI